MNRNAIRIAQEEGGSSEINREASYKMGKGNAEAREGSKDNKNRDENIHADIDELRPRSGEPTDMLRATIGLCNLQLKGGVI